MERALRIAFPRPDEQVIPFQIMASIRKRHRKDGKNRREQAGRERKRFKKEAEEVEEETPVTPVPRAEEVPDTDTGMDDDKPGDQPGCEDKDELPCHSNNSFRPLPGKDKAAVLRVFTPPDAGNPGRRSVELQYTKRSRWQRFLQRIYLQSARKIANWARCYTASFATKSEWFPCWRWCKRGLCVLTLSLAKCFGSTLQLQGSGMTCKQARWNQFRFQGTSQFVAACGW